MIKTLAIVAALTLGAGSAMAAEVGVRHSTGGSHTNTHSGRSWSNYEGNRQGGFSYGGGASTVSTSRDSVVVGGNASGGFGVGFGQPDEGDGRGASCERGRASFCNAETTDANVDRAWTTYNGGETFEETYNGGSASRFNGSSWSNFSETSTFAR